MSTDLIPSETTSTETSATKPALSWRRTLIYFALSSTMLIFDGCGTSLQYFTLGIIPTARIGIEDPLSLHLESFWFSGLLFHIALFFTAAWFIKLNWPWLTKQLQSFKMLIAWVLVWAAHNSFSFPIGVWLYAVYLPFCYVRAVVKWLFVGDLNSPFGDATITAWSGRLNALLLIVAVYLILLPISWSYHRYVLVKGSRWQFTLAGILLLTLVFGVGTGMLVRIYLILSAQGSE